MEKPSAPRILTFKEASSQKSLDKLLDKILKQEQKSYESTHLTEALKEDGTAKSFEMMRLDIAAHVYKPLLSELEKQLNPDLLKDLTTKEKLDYLAKHRYLSFMCKAQQDIAEHGETSNYLNKNNLFYLESFRHLLKRKESKPWFKEEMFSLQQGQTSEVSLDGSKEVSFFKVVALDAQDNEDIAENIREKQQTLALEAQKELMSQLLDLFKEQQTVVFIEDTTQVEG